MGNMMLISIHLLALAIEEQLLLKSAPLTTFRHVLKHPAKDDSYAYFRCPKLMQRLLRKFATDFPIADNLRIGNIHLVTDRPRALRKMQPGRIKTLRAGNLIYCGWQFRDFPTLQKHHSEIRDMFLASSECKKSKTGRHGTNDILIGIHIRRGDYERWLGGKYYYPLQTYSRIIREAQTEFAMIGKKTTFEVYSDEDQLDLIPPQDTKVIRVRGGTATEDLSRMAATDLIIAPPSTFSRFASFLGDTSLFTIWTRESEFSRKSAATYTTGLISE